MMVTRVYWDAAVFHALFGKEEGRVEACEKIIQSARSGRVEIFTSTITWVECVRLKNTPRLSPENEQVIQQFFQHRFIKPISCERIIADKARGLLWKYEHLRYKDAIHVASAITANVPTLQTYDEGDLIRLDGKVGEPPLRICKPGIEDDFTLTAP